MTLPCTSGTTWYCDFPLSNATVASVLCVRPPFAAFSFSRSMASSFSSSYLTSIFSVSDVFPLATVSGHVNGFCSPIDLSVSVCSTSNEMSDALMTMSSFPSSLTVSVQPSPSLVAFFASFGVMPPTATPSIVVLG